MQQRERPMGITILAILQLVLSGFGLLMALGMLMVAFLTGQQAIRDAIGPNVPAFVLENGSILFGLLALIFLVFSIIGLVITWGFFKGRPWARLVALGVALLYILFAFLNPLLYGSITQAVVFDFVLATIVPMFIIFYLTRESVKVFFSVSAEQGSIDPNHEYGQMQESR